MKSGIRYVPGFVLLFMTKELFIILLSFLIGGTAHAQYINGVEPSEYYRIELGKAQNTYHAGVICVSVGGVVALVSLGTTVYLINSEMKEILGGLHGTENTSGLSDKAANKLSNVALAGTIVGAATILTGVGLISAGTIKTTRINKWFQNELPSPELTFNVSSSSLGLKYAF